MRKSSGPKSIIRRPLIQIWPTGVKECKRLVSPIIKRSVVKALCLQVIKNPLDSQLCLEETFPARYKETL